MKRRTSGLRCGFNGFPHASQVLFAFPNPFVGLAELSLANLLALDADAERHLVSP